MPRKVLYNSEDVSELSFADAFSTKIAFDKDLRKSYIEKIKELRAEIEARINEAKSKNAVFASTCENIPDDMGKWGYRVGSNTLQLSPLGVGGFRSIDGRLCGCVAAILTYRDIKGIENKKELGRFYLFSSDSDWIYFLMGEHDIDVGNPVEMSEGVNTLLKQAFVTTSKPL
jgi:hypothetical protein